ncbi:flavodoxin [Arenibacter sp. M-2]|jgi:flavodoxin|uniref:Flavodoxin n=1 Tax=Arenibacter algicola TaxID=616991 RepID=A0A221UVT7_9FLAO|nr:MULTISPECIES: flavodoxin [Arenibacter]ASO05206.1 flavodoxin [Arenibacter algicola]MDL5514152.1 flavodoxin [Arenibacter sp. M-2]MDX1758026.1 flavodoxin [Arenibacter algicola]|tara:strand:+ start:4129 stop:4740 length:612 start_codon:yes stop_codon:yes gene_type:complete
MKIFAVLFLLISNCSSSQSLKVDDTSAIVPHSQKTLILYLSRTKNTKALAEIIHNELGGDLVALELVNPYPEDYDAIVKQVAQENETGFLPPLKTKVDISKYDTIFLGFPTWGMQLPPPLKSFLNDYDFTGKTVIPFNTNAGYGEGSSIKTIRKLGPNITILEVFSIKGGIERDGIYLTIKDSREREVKSEVRQWLKKIGVIH